ncbi:MAG: WD40/YVTN/BNR-like repeat-containing protein [Peptococcaceae bacterium]
MNIKYKFLFKILLIACLSLSLSGCLNSRQQKDVPYEASPDTVGSGEPAVNSGSSSNDSEETDNFLSIKMINRQDGWAESSQAVFKTENGGADWIDITPVDIKALKAQYPIQAYFFLDENCAWVMPYQKTQTKYVRQTIIFRTPDKGAHWDKFELPQTNMGTNLFFVNKDKGWMTLTQSRSLGQHPFGLYATKDGGKTWDKIHSVNMNAHSSIPLSGLISGFYFTDVQTGWLTGTTNMGLPVLEQTTDGGSTWVDGEFPYQEDSMNAGDNTSISVDPPVFFNGKDGLIRVRYATINGEIYSLFYHTGNGGKSWTKKDEKIAHTDIGSLKYSFADQNNGWLIADGKEFMKTADGGTTWTSLNDALSALSLKKILDIQFVDKNNGWILDETGLFKTTDSGKSWHKVKIEIEEMVMSEAKAQ